MKTKTCNKCGEEKTLNDFYRAKRLKSGRVGICKSCNKKRPRRIDREKTKKYRSTPEYQIHKRDWYLKKNYGVSLKWYEDTLKAQRGCCAICGTSDPGGKNKVFHVDHCHETGKIRGLLCLNCNSGLGQLGDTLENLELAAQYLRENK